MGWHEGTTRLDCGTARRSKARRNVRYSELAHSVWTFDANASLDRPCYKCGGTGEVVAFFGFDNDLCRACQGVGRVY